MRIIKIIAVIFVCGFLPACSDGPVVAETANVEAQPQPRTPPVALKVEETEETSPAIMTARTTSENASAPSAARQNDTVITEDLCTRARYKDGAAQQIVAEYYDSRIDRAAPEEINRDKIKAKDAANKDDKVTDSQRAMVAAMYWYDLAIHYGGKKESLKTRRKALGTVASDKEMSVYRNFSKNQKSPPCMPNEVFHGTWE